MATTVGMQSSWCEASTVGLEHLHSAVIDSAVFSDAFILRANREFAATEAI